jgi:hypothetical protein
MPVLLHSKRLVNWTEEIREQRIDREMTNYEKALRLEVDVPAYQPRELRGGDFLHFIGDASIKLSAIVATTLRNDLKLIGGVNGDEYVYQIMLGGSQIIYTSENGNIGMIKAKRRGEEND